MNRRQRFFREAAGGRAAAMEEESRRWMIRCPYCGYERSVWDAGGVRYKASGTSRQLQRCPQCRRMAWMQIYRPDAPNGARIAAAPLAPAGRRRLLWALGLGGLVAVVALFLVLLFALLGGITDAIVRPGDAFMTGLQTGDYATAYALCTPVLQQQLHDAAGLATLVGTNRPGHWSWSNRSIRNSVGRLDGDLTYADGRPGTVHLDLQQVADAWKIAGFQLRPR